MESANPIGKIQIVPEFEKKIIELSNRWDEKIKSSSNSWIKSNISVAAITLFLLGALDELILTINNLLENGPDKKATVLSGLERIYDYIIKEGLPIWAKPIAIFIKEYIIYYLASSAIDYFVNKYKNGVWNNEQGGLK